MTKAPKKGKGPKKRGPAKSRNVVPAEPDRPTDDDLDSQRAEADPGEREADQKLTARQRRFVEALVQDPDRVGWRAAWRAGYNGVDPDGPVPDDIPKRQALARSASKTLAKPAVAALIAELETGAAAAWLGSPEGETVREHVAAREAGQADLEALAAKNLAVMTAIAHHDPRSAVQWGPGWVTVTASDQLSYEESLLILEIRHKEWSTEGGMNSETQVKLADRTQYVKMLEQRVGKAAPVKHEVSGPGGGPIEAAVGVTIAPEGDALDECARELLGVVPASSPTSESGLSPDEVVSMIRGWESDPEPHVSRVWELFGEDALGESRARYLGDED